MAATGFTPGAVSLLNPILIFALTAPSNFWKIHFEETHVSEMHFRETHFSNVSLHCSVFWAQFNSPFHAMLLRSQGPSQLITCHPVCNQKTSFIAQPYLDLSSAVVSLFMRIRSLSICSVCTFLLLFGIEAVPQCNTVHLCGLWLVSLLQYICICIFGICSTTLWYL